MVELLKSLLRVSDYCLQTVIVRFVVETLLFIPRSKRFAYEAKRNDLRNALKVSSAASLRSAAPRRRRSTLEPRLPAPVALPRAARG